MNNKQLNNEFSQMLKDRNKKFTSQTKSGFTDSEEEDSRSLKSPMSGRSSLISGRSPRDEMPSLDRRSAGLAQLRPNNQRKISGDRSESENDPNSPRKFNRYPNERSLSPKSPRSSEESFPKYQRFNRNTNRDDDDNHNKSQPITPRSARSDRDELGNLDMMRTMRKPLSDTLTKTIKRSEAVQDNFQAQKTRSATPTKLGLGQRYQTGLNAKSNFTQRRMQFGSKLDTELEEEEPSRSGKTSPSRSGSRLLSNANDDQDIDLDEDELHKSSRSVSPRARLRSRTESPRSEQMSRSTQDSLDVRESNENVSKQAYDKHVSACSHLINPKIKKSDSSESQKMAQEARRVSIYNRMDKDPEVVETVEDKNISEKLHKEREQKRILREKKTKNMTESSKKIEDAIEKVENTMQDSLRLESLKEMTSELKYASKPSLEEMLKNERISRSRNMSAKERDNSRTRSLSSSGRFEKTLNSKYANVKPKTQTRLQIQSARTTTHELSNSNLNCSHRDVMNDSASLRQNIYTEWYQKKMLAAQQQLKEAKHKQKDVEEKKAQELIEKLQKSKLIFKMWSEKKEETLKEKRKFVDTTVKKDVDKELDKREKKKEAEIAFREWLRIKLESQQVQKVEKLETERKNEKEKRKQKEKENEGKKPPKPPVPYDAWAKKKEDEVKEKQRSKEEKERQKQMQEMERQKKRELATRSYYEWLDKKEQDQDLNKTKHLSTSMSSLPPFYPTSKTIPFGR